MEIGREYVVPLNQKEMKIYDRTKNRRIKKKQIKKAPIIGMRNTLTQMLKKGNIQINIGGRKIEKVNNNG